MRMDGVFYNLFMYLYNKNVLEYAQIARSGPKSMIRDIEGLSTNYEPRTFWPLDIPTPQKCMLLIHNNKLFFLCTIRFHYTDMGNLIQTTIVL